MTFILDPALKEFATKKQWKTLQAWEEHGSQRAAAKALGIDKANLHSVQKAVRAKATKQGYSPEHDMRVPIADGYKLRGTSTLYDEEGAVKIQWVKTQEDKERQHEIFMEIVDELASALPRIDPVPFTIDKPAQDLMSCYPVGDHHLGMLSWAEETGKDYDITIGESLLKGASDYLMNLSPPSVEGLLVFLGDFMHYDGFTAETPTSRNALDSDTRYPKMVRAAIRSMRYMIEQALRRHELVTVITEIGNHDLSSSIFLMECLSNIYENEPRVVIDTSPSHYHYKLFGRTLVGTHHGHGTKMANLPLTMATDRPEEWGATDHRMWWTGHIHTSKTQAAVSAQDYSGCTVESFRILPPPDAWAAQKGYRAISGMKSIILHREWGETARFSVHPAMLSEET